VWRPVMWGSARIQIAYVSYDIRTHLCVRLMRHTVFAISVQITHERTSCVGSCNAPINRLSRVELAFGSLLLIATSRSRGNDYHPCRNDVTATCLYAECAMLSLTFCDLCTVSKQLNISSNITLVNTTPDYRVIYT